MSKAAWIEENLKPGEIYAGISLGKKGAPDHHVILLPVVAAEVTWAEAKEFAAKAGGELPTRSELTLLFANLKEEFEARWHWSSEQYSVDPSYAWMQSFGHGGQGYHRKSLESRVRPVRRVAI